MNLSDLFNFGGSPKSTTELPVVFPMPILQKDFVAADVQTIYSKILTDALERTHGLSDDQVALLWDNCVKSSKNDGLITLLARAMAAQEDLFIVWDKTVNVVRRATSQEAQTIKADYEATAGSTGGVFITFKNYRRSDMVALYSALDYCTVAALYKDLNLASAPQLKFSDLRGSVSLTDSTQAEAQAQAIATALIEGRPIMLDAKDFVELATPDLSAVSKSVEFISNKLGFYLNMPASYITSLQTAGIGSTGESDARAVDQGLKGYFFPILKPVLEAIFGASVTFKTQDFRNQAAALELLKTFSLVDEEFVSLENKQRIVNRVFDLPEDAKGSATKEAQAVPLE